MKTYEIKDLLKSELLIVELPENTQFDVLVGSSIWKDGIKFLTGTEEKFHFIEGSYTLLGSPDEIKEEDARKLVHQSIFMGGLFAHHVSGVNPPNVFCYKTALESFNSALESEISLVDNKKYWNKEKTFNRSRTRIFVKQ